jgi:hypothetical protein
MPWLVPAVFASFAAAVFLWTRGLRVPAAMLGIASIALLFIVGRGIESGRDAGWREVAARLHGSFRPGPACAGLDRFGTPAPWTEWSRDGELQCTRAIDGEDAGVAWALVQIRYSVRERRGEEHPDSWYEVTVAVMRLRAVARSRNLVPVAAPDGYGAMQNGESLFLWKKGPPGAGASVIPAELPALLELAKGVRTR